MAGGGQLIKWAPWGLQRAIWLPMVTVPSIIWTQGYCCLSDSFKFPIEIPIKSMDESKTEQERQREQALVLTLIANDTNG